MTTTHVPGEDANYNQEPIAQAGHLQSTPQPLPGFDNVCLGTYDVASRTYSDLGPLRDALAIAVECMAEPEPALLEVTDAQLNCALPDSSRPGCTDEVGGVDRDGDTFFTINDVFPQFDEYRAIPKVLRAQDYTTDGVLDVARLRADFACMSMVGTRGYGIEKGLQAAVAAVDPVLTRDGGPNAGFLRQDSSFAVVFVSDENDCSHDGGIAEFGQLCRGAICDYENAADLRGEPSNLTPLPTLARRLRTNLADSKGRNLFSNEVLVASLHGGWRPFDGPMPACAQGDADDRPEVPSACSSADLGVAFSGDRYDRFMRQFPRYYPNGVTGAGSDPRRFDVEGYQEAGVMCSGDLSGPMAEVGAFLSGGLCED